MRRWWLVPVYSVGLWALVIGLVLPFGVGSLALAQEAPAEEAADDSADKDADALADELSKDSVVPGDDVAGSMAEIEKLFNNFLHFAVIGQFEYADKSAEALLAHPQIEPLSAEAAVALVMLSEKYESSMDTLLILINNSSISANAGKILALIRRAHRQQRTKLDRIVENIQLLSGTPTQRAFGLERLTESGEYAVPEMLLVLADPREKTLHPFVSRALPQLGKRAANPLVEALSMDSEVVQRSVAEALGRIGYPQALPYLKRLVENEQANEAVRLAAREAIAQIVVADPSVRDGSAAVLFADLAESYYAEKESLQADPREDKANVWYVRDGQLQPIEVPRSIFCMVMSMRCCASALELDKNQPETLALWLAANFRRESRLGLDVESTESTAADDATRPENFPRSIYFARSTGPRYTQLTLKRAIADRDRDVALGAIAGLNVTAGAKALVGSGNPDSSNLAAALNFPDLLVRIKAALALGGALPKESFKSSDDVVSTLASALSLTGKKAYLLVDPDAASREKLQNELQAGGAVTVVSADRLGAALLQAHKELTHLDAIFLASDMQRPTPAGALAEIAKDNRFAIAPIVLLVKENNILVADRVADADPRVGFALATPNDKDDVKSLVELLLTRKQEVGGKFGHRELSPELSVKLALESAATLKVMATAASQVFDVLKAAPSLIDALSHPSEELRIASAGVLALLDSGEAQLAIAKVALDDKQTETLRKVSFGALAESARRFGPKLDEATNQALIKQAIGEPNLQLRTAASQALGAMNLPGQLATEVILTQSK